MKKQNRLLLASLFSVLAIFAVVPHGSFAATKKHVQTNTDTATQTDAVPYSVAVDTHTSRETETAVGASTVNAVNGTPAVTAIFDMNPTDMIQAFLGIGGTVGTFQIGVGALYKHTLVGTHAFGLHVGGGLAYQNVASAGGGSTGLVLITGVAGLHARIPGLERIAFHLDAGPSLGIANSTTSFSLGALSSALGLSVLYYL